MQATPTPGASQVLSRDEARALTARVLAFSTADQTRVTVISERSGNTRFADGSITTSGGSNNTSVSVTVTFGRRRASSSTNVLDDAALRRTVDLASRLARLAPEDPELMPELGPQTYEAVDAFVGATADLDAEGRADAIGRAINAATAAGKAAGSIFAAGYLETNAIAITVANNNGLFAYHRTTDADFSVTARTPDGTGSGWAHGGAHDWNAVDPVGIGRTAAQKAVASRKPRE